MAENSHSDPNTIQRQVTLPLSKAVEISIKSLKIRFGRSLITTGGIMLAIAFLMSTFVSTAVTGALLEKGSPEIRAQLEDRQEETRARDIWLVTLSLMVCVVGITNAMLMSVTERYREIGTMKCLGALNRFIVKLFLLESAFQGVLGSLVGALVGGTAMLIASLANYGGQVLAIFPLLLVAKYLLISVGMGTSLSVVGAIYPAYQAARMVPAEAMRMEV